ncbi:MAG: hypothetical protein OXH75_26600 [Acidobacteria bacterium]|nr:hypothetical protein [Acidobacteriota bacterium]
MLEATNGEQRPHEYQSLLREHYLSGAPAVEAVTVEAAAPAVVDVDVGELDLAQLGCWPSGEPRTRKRSSGCGTRPGVASSAGSGKMKRDPVAT